MNFEKYQDTKIRAKDRGFSFDVRTGAKTDERQVSELVADIAAGIPVRPAYVDLDNTLIDGRNASEAYTRAIGGDNPLIPVRQFPWRFNDLSDDAQQEVKNWALIQNLGKGAFRRFATVEDKYLRIHELVVEGWTDGEIREAFRSNLNNYQITELVNRARKAKHNQMAEAIRLAMESSPNAKPEKIVHSMASTCTEAEIQSLLKSAQTRRSKKGPRVKVRGHHFGSRMNAGLKAIESHAQVLLDSYREVQAGRTGTSRAGYLQKLREIQETARRFENAFAEVVRRGLSEMGATAEELDKPKSRKQKS